MRIPLEEIRELQHSAQSVAEEERSESLDAAADEEERSEHTDTSSEGKRRHGVDVEDDA